MSGRARGTAIYPFVPAGADFAIAIAFFADLGFDAVWRDEGLAGLRFGKAYFLLQDINVPEWQSNQMITVEVDDLDVYWQEIGMQNLPAKYRGVQVKPPTEFAWGREMHIIDPAGVCWHFRQTAAPG